MVQLRTPITPFPHGWYLVAWSDELGPGQVKAVRYFDQELVVFRGEDGRAAVLDAYCAHLGAHLGKGGTVCGNTIQCPFHRWRYDGAGRCAHIPYASKIPPAAKVRSWPVHEADGMVLVWFHEAGAPPSWDMPRIPMEYRDEAFTPWHETRWTVRTCIQDVNENDVDVQHLAVLHQFTSRPPENPTIHVDGPQMEIHSHLYTNLEVFGMPGEGKGPLVTRKYGLGIGFIMLEVDIGPFTLCVRTLGCTTPIDREHVDIRLMHGIRKTQFDHVNDMLTVSYAATFKRTVEQDIPIWENKIHLLRPVLCEGDGPIAQYRKWTRQFYAPEELERAMAR
jgi:nitrite reductase/ring-hydroxylating ferredoxin subunit